MLSVSIKHPDSEAFIDAKMTEGKVTGANVSVRVDDEFMRAAEADAEYEQKFPVDSEHPYVSKKINANALWRKIVHNAWKSAEPGVLFWDTITRESIPDCYADLGFKTISTNPCGEIPLCPYDSCRLIAVNLYSYVKNPFTAEAEFDFDLFRQHIRCAQRLMDDIIDLEMEKIDKIIAKIESDPETEEVKATELNLWKKIRNKTWLDDVLDLEQQRKEICLPQWASVMELQRLRLSLCLYTRRWHLRPTVFGRDGKGAWRILFVRRQEGRGKSLHKPIEGRRPFFV